MRAELRCNVVEVLALGTLHCPPFRSGPYQIRPKSICSPKSGPAPWASRGRVPQERRQADRYRENHGVWHDETGGSVREPAEATELDCVNGTVSRSGKAHTRAMGEARGPRHLGPWADSHLCVCASKRWRASGLAGLTGNFLQSGERQAFRMVSLQIASQGDFSF